MKQIVVVGGDKREVTVARRLLAAGYAVASYALPDAALPPEVTRLHDDAGLRQALARADAAILPMPPLGEDLLLYSMKEQDVYLDSNTFVDAPAGMPLLTGIVTPCLTALAPQCVAIGLLENEEIALPLAEATAEGAIAEAIRLSDGILYGEQALVIGYGRIGKALAWRLDALGMEVIVLNRSDAGAELARDYGFIVGDWSQLTAIAARSAYIFNTAPAPLLQRQQLQWLRQDALFVDLAAKPGGTDFAAAAELGVKAVLAGGLPGKYAPRYAGEVMADVYLDRLAFLLGKEEQ